MKSTMLDIANACGVSKTLVSRIVNKDITLKIPAQTRERVLYEIEKQNYIPNFSARALKNEKQQTLDVAYKIGFGTFSKNGLGGHPYFSHIFSGAVDEANRQKCMIVPVILQWVSGHFTVTCSEKLDGVILPMIVEYKELKDLLASEFQHIVSLEGFFNARSDIVETIITSSLRLGLEHLYSLGYRDFGLLSGDIASRVEDFYLFLHEYGLEARQDFTLNCRNNMTISYQIVAETLKSTKPPRAIMCHNDEMAIGCMRALLEAGYRIPEDVAIVGHDDIDMAGFTQVPLTTVRIYKEDIGRLAVTVLLDRIRNERKVPVHLEIPGKLIIRQSCGGKK